MTKNGFDTTSYNWGNYMINKQLEGVLDQKSGVKIWRVLAVTSGVLAIDKYIRDEEGRGFFITFSLTSGLISQIKLNKTRKRIQQINIWKESIHWYDSSETKSMSHAFQSMQKNGYEEEEGNPNFAAFEDISQLTIDRNFHLKSPYKVSQNRYLNNNGFDIQGYDWQNENTNLQLNKALKSRSAGQGLLIAAIPITVLGLLANLVHALSEDPNKSSNYPGTGYFIASGGLLTGSLILTSNAKHRVKSANKMRTN
ncbi:hypothetical protein [Reichenbachiella faecimaris]|uniref:hypothetical protein n=1 Tax=Reichenbachiella faecimaris TaxID=692418 RepID=UPI00111C34B6|nr:hypothetical protein [Reichenbachiella faecimaris]